MYQTDISRMRKRLMNEQVSVCAERPGEIDIASLARFASLPPRIRQLVEDWANSLSS